MTLLYLHTLSLLLWLLQLSAPLHLRQDLEQDLQKLQQSGHFISDTSTDRPSLQTLQQDLQLFSLVANLDLSQATDTSYTQGKHHVRVWRLKEGQIQKIVQVDSQLAMDTVVTQRYLENRPPSQHRIQNTFTLRSYSISTADAAAKLLYLREAEQGLLQYTLGEKEVQVTYMKSKDGLSDVLPKYRQEVQQLLQQSM